jgi:hypothetical protein
VDTETITCWHNSHPTVYVSVEDSAVRVLWGCAASMSSVCVLRSHSLLSHPHHARTHTHAHAVQALPVLVLGDVPGLVEYALNISRLGEEETCTAGAE